MQLPFGIVLCYPSLADDGTPLLTCCGQHFTMVTENVLSVCKCSF